jgi:hypothetical protein
MTTKNTVPHAIFNTRPGRCSLVSTFRESGPEWKLERPERVADLEISTESEIVWVMRKRRIHDVLHIKKMFVR